MPTAHPTNPPSSPPDPDRTRSQQRSDTPATYQQSLDESLDETFPASDPISPSALQAQEERLSTPADRVDWPLHTGSASRPLPASWAAVLGAMGSVMLCRRAGRAALLLAAGAGALLGAACSEMAAGRRRNR